MSGVDKSWCRKKVAQNKRLEQEGRRRQRAAAEYAASFSNAKNGDARASSPVASRVGIFAGKN